jgi:TonB family protein
MNERVMAILLACTFELSAWAIPLAGQDCRDAERPTYEQVVDGISQLASILDTLTIRERRHVTIAVQSGGQQRTTLLGRPTAATAESASSICRFALLWTTRGDSLIATWLVTSSRVATIADSTPADLTPPDQPRPIHYDLFPGLLDPGARDRLVSQLFQEAGEPKPRGATMVLALIDTSGVVVIARLLRSSGVRALDEAALEIWRHQRYTPAVSEGRRVAVWFASPISWQRR